MARLVNEAVGAKYDAMAGVFRDTLDACGVSALGIGGRTGVVGLFFTNKTAYLGVDDGGGGGSGCPGFFCT